ncbi:hypothetical protein LJB92_01210 [Bacteroidales bacterium OttesenSCG-928-M06]|nr:hypothetical protein [Bacteroidales bacterium OttesenSCG-928-M06]
MDKKIILTIYLVVILLPNTYTTFAQGNFQEYAQQERAAFENYKQQERKNFKQYRDSINKEFASFLEKEWKNFDLQKPEPLIKKPIDTPPIYDNTKPKPLPEEFPNITPLPKPEPKPKPKSEPIPPIPTQQATINTSFFGTDIEIIKISVSIGTLKNVTEKEVAQYWKMLTNTPYTDIINEAERIKTKLKLNDWGLYQLLNLFFEVYFPQGTANEQVIYNVFMLNQLNYRAKIGRVGNELIPLLAFQQEVYNNLFFQYGNVKYSALNPYQKSLSGIQSCEINYTNATRNIDLSILESPCFTKQTETKTLDFENKNYTLTYNPNTVKFYTDYPCVHFSIYAEAELDAVFQESIEKQIKPLIIGKSQEEAVNILLHFVQNAFKYKTDYEQFGYEKWFFAEETIASSYSDCEDRAILFSQLVRKLLSIPVVLIHYTDVHLATAVKFNNPLTTGDYFTIDGEKYLICDPTYINANLGMSMPNLKNTRVEIIKLNQ